MGWSHIWSRGRGGGYGLHPGATHSVHMLPGTQATVKGVSWRLG